MILEIDVTVTGPGQVLTGSVAVTVNAPLADFYTNVYEDVYGEQGPPSALAEEALVQAVPSYTPAMRWAQR